MPIGHDESLRLPGESIGTPSLQNVHDAGSQDSTSSRSRGHNEESNALSPPRSINETTPATSPPEPRTSSMTSATLPPVVTTSSTTRTRAPVGIENDRRSTIFPCSRSVKMKLTPRACAIAKPKMMPPTAGAATRSMDPGFSSPATALRARRAVSAGSSRTRAHCTYVAL